MTATSILQELRRPARGRPDWLSEQPAWLDASLRISAADSLSAGDPLPMSRWLSAHVDALGGFDVASQTLRDDARPLVQSCARRLCELVYPFGGADTPNDVHDVAVAFWRSMTIVFRDWFPGGPRSTRDSLDGLADALANAAVHRALRAPGMLADATVRVLADGGLLASFDAAVLTTTSETVHLLHPDDARTLCGKPVPASWFVVQGAPEPATCQRCVGRRQRHPARQSVEDPALTLAPAFSRAEHVGRDTFSHLLATSADVSRDGLTAGLLSIMARQLCPELADRAAALSADPSWPAICCDRRRLHPRLARALRAACGTSDPYAAFTASLAANPA